MTNRTSRSIVAAVACALAAITAHAEPPVKATPGEGTPAIPVRNAYFGQLHLHTGMSFDAFLIGTRLYPEDAYRYARGETIEHEGRRWTPTGPPLDFLGVSDHA